MKKKLLIVALVLAVIFAGVSIYVVKSGLFSIWTWSQDVTFPVYVDIDDFNKYSEDFQILADFAISESEEQNYPKDAYIGVDRSDGVRLCYSEDYEFIPLNDQMQNSLERVNQSFSDAGGDFGSIRIYEDKIEFTVDNYNFALVYSRDGSKPEYVPSEFETDPKAKIKKLKKDWYTISVN